MVLLALALIGGISSLLLRSAGMVLFFILCWLAPLSYLFWFGRTFVRSVARNHDGAVTLELFTGQRVHFPGGLGNPEADTTIARLRFLTYATGDRRIRIAVRDEAEAKLVMSMLSLASG
jgi:hypothetical protein